MSRWWSYAFAIYMIYTTSHTPKFVILLEAQSVFLTFNLRSVNILPQSSFKSGEYRFTSDWATFMNFEWMQLCQIDSYCHAMFSEPACLNVERQFINVNSPIHGLLSMLSGSHRWFIPTPTCLVTQVQAMTASNAKLLRVPQLGRPRTSIWWKSNGFMTHVRTSRQETSLTRFYLHQWLVVILRSAALFTRIVYDTYAKESNTT